MTARPLNGICGRLLRLAAERQQTAEAVRKEYV